MTTIRNEPVMTSAVVTVIVWLSSRYAIDLDATTATAIAAIVLAVGNGIARRFSVPTAKAENAIDLAYHADPATARKPTL